MASYKDTEGRPKDIIYVVCPLCGRNRVLEVTSDKAKAKGKGKLRWDFFDTETSPLIQIRRAGGKLPKEQQVRIKGRAGQATAEGFRITDSLTLEQAKEQGYNDQVEAIKKQIQKLNQKLLII